MTQTSTQAVEKSPMMAAVEVAVMDLERRALLSDQYLRERDEARAGWKQEVIDRNHAALERDALKALCDGGVQALLRAEGCVRGLVARVPVRDVDETLAELTRARTLLHLHGGVGDG